MMRVSEMCCFIKERETPSEAPTLMEQHDFRSNSPLGVELDDDCECAKELDRRILSAQQLACHVPALRRLLDAL